MAANYFLERDFIFQEENAPINKVKDYIRNDNVAVLLRPTNSPDLNPMENCWAVIKQKFQKRNTLGNFFGRHHGNSLEDMERAIFILYNRIVQKYAPMIKSSSSERSSKYI